MSNEEKAAQIGEAMLLLESHKQDLAHLQTKIEKVKQAYKAFASNSDRWQIDASDSKRIFLARPAQEERDLASYLFSAAELASLVGERDTANARLQQTRAKLTAFGITLQ